MNGVRRRAGDGTRKCEKKGNVNRKKGLTRRKTGPGEGVDRAGGESEAYNKEVDMIFSKEGWTEKGLTKLVKKA